jgi:hypothetical protein
VMHAFPVRDIDPHRGLLQRRLRRCRAVSGKRPRECLAACARLRAERPPSSREPRPPLALAPRAPARPESVRCRALSPAASLPRRRHGSAALLSRIRPGRYTPTGREALPSPRPAPARARSPAGRSSLVPVPFAAAASALSRGRCRRAPCRRPLPPPPPPLPPGAGRHDSVPSRAPPHHRPSMVEFWWQVCFGGVRRRVHPKPQNPKVHYKPPTERCARAASARAARGPEAGPLIVWVLRNCARQPTDLVHLDGDLRPPRRKPSAAGPPPPRPAAPLRWEGRGPAAF